jgi:5-methylcytosine-specific restriction protein A
MTRREFPARVRVAAFQRANGHCEGCTVHLTPGKFAYDHDLPDWLGGEPILSNCKVLCDACHGAKTAGGDVPRIAKAKRQRAAHAGIRPPSRLKGAGFPAPVPQHSATRKVDKIMPRRGL